MGGDAVREGETQSTSLFTTWRERSCQREERSREKKKKKAKQRMARRGCGRECLQQACVWKVLEKHRESGLHEGLRAALGGWGRARLHGGSKIIWAQRVPWCQEPSER